MSSFTLVFYQTESAATGQHRARAPRNDSPPFSTPQTPPPHHPGAAVSVMSSRKPHQSQDLQTGSCGLVARPRPHASCLVLRTTAHGCVHVRGACAGFHCAWVAKGLPWPCSPESTQGSLRRPDMSAIVPPGKALQDQSRLVVDTLLFPLVFWGGGGGAAIKTEAELFFGKARARDSCGPRTVVGLV